MGTRSFAQVAPTSATIALNAYIFGYAGHSLVTPHAALKQQWWTDERIEAKVTRNFVISKLRGEEREFLDRPLAFGEGLTDDTYMDWILERAKRLFLILTEVGVPDQIFGCIDDSWDDDDLPIPLEDVRSLELAIENDEVLNKKFYDTQFLYLLRELSQGAHIDYGPREHIPMEYVNTLPPAVTLQIWDRVHFPENPEEIFMRRKYPLVDKETDHDYRSSFMRDVRKAQALKHEHIACTWASYSSENAAYVMSDFVGEHTLGTFIEHRTPTQLLRVPTPERPILMCEWMHCLADALASLHHRSAAHTAIRPSNILIDRTNHIAFADVGSLRTFQRGKKVNKNEVYNYAAPESQLSQEPREFASSPPVSSVGAFSKLRKMSSSTSSSSTTSSTASSTRTNSICTVATSPITPPSTGRSNSLTTVTTTISPIQDSCGSFRNFSRVLPPPTTIDPSLLRDLPQASAEMSDIYSLACVFLDIVTFVMKGKINDFVKFRTTRVTSSTPNGKRTRSDSSFHADPDKIDAWMTVLRDDSARRTESIYRGIPHLLVLIRRMMVQNATLRPTAKHVRDRLEEILVGECGIEALCCTNREWDVVPISDAATVSSRRPWRDFKSVAFGAPVTPVRTGSECVRTASRSGDQASLISRTESKQLSAKSRRSSSASMATPKVSSWRKAFTRSS